MEIIYKAYDGEEFSNEADCLRHEKQTSYFVMWNDKGIVSSIESALLVKIDSVIGIDRFTDIAYSAHGYDCDYVTKPGFYFWDELADKFMPLNEEIMASLKHYFYMQN